MKIQKIFSAINYAIAYRILSISGMIFIIGVTIRAIRLKPDIHTKIFVIFITALGLFVIISLLFIVNLFSRQENTASSQKKGIIR